MKVLHNVIGRVINIFKYFSMRTKIYSNNKLSWIRETRVSGYKLASSTEFVKRQKYNNCQVFF